MSEAAEYDPRFPVHLAIDCGVSRHVARSGSRSGGLDPEQRRVTVFGDFHAEGLYSEAAAKAIWSRGGKLPGLGRARHGAAGPGSVGADRHRPDGLRRVRAGLRPAALARWPSHRVTDGLDQLEVLLDRGSCCSTRGARRSSRRSRTTPGAGPAGGDWLDEPADPQHPHEDLMDALRGGVRDRFPEGRVEQPKMHQVQAGRIF